jgi:hypothetical protein
MLSLPRTCEGEELLSIHELINRKISLMFLSGNISVHMGHSISQFLARIEIQMLNNFTETNTTASLFQISEIYRGVKNCEGC